MKKNIYTMLLLAFTMIGATSCKEDLGTEPGGDSTPVATLYSYETSLPYNPDNDVRVRVAANNAVQEVYCLAEKSEDYAKNIASMGEEGYKNYVVENGGKVKNLVASSYVDSVFTDLMGEYKISAVAVNGNEKTLRTVTFMGLIWEDVVKGTYYFNETGAKKVTKVESIETTLQKCTNSAGVYRFKNLYGKGFNLKFFLTGDRDKDDDGEYSVVYAPSCMTSYSYGSYGSVYARDVYSWQGNNSDFLNGAFYDNNALALWMQYYVDIENGNLGYGWEYFVPAE